jgi:menaquinone-dependent protoporphyrinogen oxidase
MARILVLHASKNGQTRKIATRLAERLRRIGNVVYLYDAEHPPTPELLAKIDAVLIGSWVRGGQHMPPVRRFVMQHHELLSRVPSALFSVGLLQLSTREKSRRRAAENVTLFLNATHWRPRLAVMFGGAIPYSHFGWLSRHIEHMIWMREGLETDIAEDREYTRWDEVDRFADAFDELLPGHLRERVSWLPELRLALRTG